MVQPIFDYKVPVDTGQGDFASSLGINREYLEILVNNTPMLKHCYMGYSANNYGNADPKEGDVFLVKIAPRYFASEGAKIEESHINYIKEQVIPVYMNYWHKFVVGMQSQQATLFLNSLRESFVIPAAKQAVTDLDFQANGMYTEIYNQVGTPGTTPDDMKVFLDAGKILDDNQVARDANRICVIDTDTPVFMIYGERELLNPQAGLAAQFATGVLTKTAGFTFEVTQNARIHENGNFVDSGSGLSLTQNMVNDDNTIHIKGLVTDGTATINVGDVFSIYTSGTPNDWLNPVNYGNKQRLGYAQKFSVQSIVGYDHAQGHVAVKVNPTPHALEDAYQNMNRLGLADDVVVFDGAPNQRYGISLAFYDQETFCAVSANLYVPPNGVFNASSEELMGISSRMFSFYEGREDNILTRMDMLWGYRATRPEMGVRIVTG